MKFSTFKISLIFSLCLSLGRTYGQERQFSTTDIACMEECSKGARVHSSSARAAGGPMAYDMQYARMRWEIEPSQNYIKGAVLLRFVPKAAGLDSILVDLIDQLQVDSIRYHGQRLAIVRNQTDILTIKPRSRFTLNRVDSVEIFYQGVPIGTNGFGSFIQDNHNGTPVVWTLSEPYGAPEWWPCKSDLNDKIDSIDVYITCPTGNRGISNGLLVSETIPVAGKVLSHWRHRYPIPAYLVCMAVTNYTKFDLKVALARDSMLLQNFFYPENAAAFSVDVLRIRPTIHLYDSLFGPYPFAKEKYGHTQFGWGGGMEHTTNSFMVNFSTDLMAHELAHQWFGDKVTCGSWGDIWLNEGFATYCTGLNRLYNIGTNSWEAWKTNSLNSILSQPGGSVYVEDTSNVGRIFNGRLSYSKGAYVLNMLRWQLGDSAFYSGLRNYMADPLLAYSFSRTSQLQAHLEAASGQALGGFFSNWIYGQGFPTYTVAYNQFITDSVDVTISQTTSDPSVSFFAMPVQIRLSYTNGVRATNIRLNHTTNNQTFRLKADGRISAIVFDPQRWLISTSSVSGIVASKVPMALQPLALVPNPAATSIGLVGIAAYPVHCTIADAVGRRVLVKAASESAKINISGLAPGVYHLRATDATGQQYATKLVKQ